MEKSSDSVFELFLDEDHEVTPNPNVDSPYKYSPDEYKEETEPAFLFKGAYAPAIPEDVVETASDNSQPLEYAYNPGEYSAYNSYTSYSDHDTPVKTPSRPKISDRIKAFEQLSNSNSSPPQINKYVDDNYDYLEHNQQAYPSELQRQESSSSLYITDEEASQSSYGDIDQEESQGIPARAVPAPHASEHNRDWNNEFQILISLPTQSTLERLDRAKQIQLFVQEFTSEVSKIGKVIINEVGKATLNKTYPPVNVGGIAGGEKYLVNNIFFKFALDIYHLYGGTEFAMKAANMELLGLDAYLDAQKVVHGLRIPLMCLLDYKGYRLAATTVLPIDKDTLIYGSADGGKTVMMSNPVVNKAMEDAAKYLNIKPHRVTDILVTIHSPIDIEVHAARDNNYYVLDSARVWPPEHPVSFLPAMLLPAKGDNIEKFDLEISKLSSMLGQSLEKASSVLSEGVVYFGDQKELDSESMNEFASIIAGFPIKGKAVFIYGFQGRFLYNQLRPEFVKRYSKPLSSDAFSGFGKHDAKEHNFEIVEATKYLRDNVIRGFADKLLSGELVASSGSSIVDLMHQHGINTRYLGLLLNYCSDDSRLSGTIMTEMVARTLKNFMKRKLRMMKTREDAHCQKIIVKYLNIALGNSPHSELFWNKLIYLLMEMKFGQYLTSKINQKLKNPLRFYISSIPLLFGLLRHIGVKLNEEIHKQIIYDKSFLEAKQPFKVDDIATIDSSFKGLKFGSPKEFNQLISQHVEFLVKDIPQHNSVEYLLRAKKEKQKIVQGFYGNNHFECALSVTELASFYVSENRLEEAKAHLVLANELLYITREVPVEAFLSLMLSFGLVEEKLGNTPKALDYYLIGLGLIDRLFSPLSKGYPGMMLHMLLMKLMHHPMLLFFLNNCIKYLKNDSKAIVDFKDLAGAYFNTWKTLEFPGDSDARARVFGADYPYAMSLVWEEHLPTLGTNINQQMANKLMHVEQGDKPLSDQATQQWLNKVMLNDNQSGVTIYVNMEADDLLKLKFPVPRLFVPDQVNLGQSLQFSWEGIDVQKRPYKIRLVSVPDAYLSDVATVTEVETYSVSSFTGEMSIPPTKLAKPGQYYLDVTDGPFTTNARLFGFIVVAPDTPSPDNFSIEPSSRKLAVEYKLLGKAINGSAMVGTGGFILVNGEDPLFVRKSDEGVSAVLKGKDVLSLKSTHFELVRIGYNIVEKITFLGITRNNQLYTWGYGKNYANGHGSEDTITVPRAVASLTGVRIFDACGGADFMAVLTTKGEILLCGTLPWTDKVLKTFTPFELPKKERVVSICASAHGLCLLTEKGYVLYYGATYEDLKKPTYVSGIKLTFTNEKIVDFAAGTNHHLFVSESGKIAALGINSSGSLGYGHAETMKYLSEDTELKPANQCPGVNFVRVFAYKSYSAAIDDIGRFYYWGSGLLLPRSPVALSKYNIKSVHFLPAHIIVSTNPAAPHKLQLEPSNEVQLAQPVVNNNNIQNVTQELIQARDQLLVDYFGATVKEFLTKCGLTAEQISKAELALNNAGLAVNDVPLLTMTLLSQIIDDQFTVLKIAQRITSYYLKVLANVNN